ncbi:MAG: hypothetical protein ACE5I5_15645 [Candidatus Heimdallarchaeota archaeon]
MKSNEKRDEEGIGWKPKQYIAFIIAMFQTVLLPILLLIALFFVLVLFIG